MSLKDLKTTPCRMCPETGRTHQIRVHMNTLSIQWWEDPLYGKGNRALYDDSTFIRSRDFFYSSKNQKESGI